MPKGALLSPPLDCRCSIYKPTGLRHYDGVMYVDFDPVLFSLGPIQVRWYGLMYVVGFVAGGVILRYLVDRGFFRVSKKQVDSLITYLLVGMFLGARLAYVFIYNWGYYKNHLLELFSVWQGGLSFHGAVVGMVLAAGLFARNNRVPWLQVTDSMALAGAQGLFFGRIGNFINGELYGRVTDWKIGMVFAGGGPLSRHPSQLYEAFMEGIVLSAVLWAMVGKVKNYGTLTMVFLVGYGVFRFAVEFVRQPDNQLGYYFGWMTMGQILCSAMILAGVGGFFFVRRYRIPITRMAS